MNGQGKVIMDYQEEYKKRKDAYTQSAAIKCLIDESFELRDDKKYEDFIKKLVMILGI